MGIVGWDGGEVRWSWLVGVEGRLGGHGWLEFKQSH